MKKIASVARATRATEPPSGSWRGVCSARRARAAALLALGLLAGCVTRRVHPQHDPDRLVVPRAGAVDLALESAQGARFNLADYRGRALLVLAFTTDHVPSQALMRSLEAVARRHPASLGVVAIAGDTGAPAVLRVVLETYASVVGVTHVRLALASDEVRSGASALGAIERIPTLYFINRAGVIVRCLEAMLSEPQLEALIAPAIPSGA